MIWYMIFLIDERSGDGCINEYITLWTPLALLYIAASMFHSPWNTDLKQSPPHFPILTDTL